MPGPTTEVLSDDLKSLRDDLHRLDVGQAEIRTELRLLVGLAKWGLGLIASTMIGGAVTGIWWASSITADVRNLSAQMAEIRAAVMPTAR